MEELLLRHASHGRLPRPAVPRRLRIVAVALRARPSSHAVRGFLLMTAPALALEHVLPSPPVAADTAAILLAVGVPQEDLRRAVGMCPELLSVPVETITAALRFLTEEAGVPAEELPRVLWRRLRLLVSPVAAQLLPTLYFLRALGVPDLPSRADLLSFSVEDKLLPRIEFLESLGLPSRATLHGAPLPGALLLRHRQQHAAQGGVPPGHHGTGRRQALRLPGVLLLRARHAHRTAPRGVRRAGCQDAAACHAPAGGGQVYGVPRGLRRVHAATAEVAPMARLLGGRRRRQRRRGGREGQA